MAKVKYRCKFCGEFVPWSNAAGKLEEIRIALGLHRQGTLQEILNRINTLTADERASRAAAADARRGKADGK